MSKGSNRRPSQLSERELEERWRKVFDKPIELAEVYPSKIMPVTPPGDYEFDLDFAEADQ